MLIHRGKRFAFLANPKTATTTIERWLSPDSVPGLTRIAGDARFKHANYRTFVGMMGAYGEPVAEYEVACIVRHPLDKARSWYRFRCRPEIADQPDRYLGDRTFASYIADAITRHTDGSWVGFLNLHFVTDDRGEVAVNRIFPFERIDAALEYLRARLDVSTPLPQAALNRSADRDTSLPPDLERAFRQAFAGEIAWYESLSGSPDGHGHRPSGGA